jgi:hypothetical protein
VERRLEEVRELYVFWELRESKTADRVDPWQGPWLLSLSGTATHLFDPKTMYDTANTSLLHAQSHSSAAREEDPACRQV